MVTNPVAQGAVSRATVALLATGGYAMLVGVVFLLPFLLNAQAQQNDVFLTNLFLGPPIFAIGSTLVILNLASVGAPRTITVVLAAVNLAIVTLGTVPAILGLASLAGLDGYRAIAPILATYAVLLVGVSVVLARAHRRRQAWGRALLLAVSGAGVVSVVYVRFGSRYYAFGETPTTGSHLPPYLDLPVLGLSLLVGIAIFFIGWLWDRSPTGTRRPPKAT